MDFHNARHMGGRRFPPRLVGDALLFGRLNQRGGHDLCLLSVQRRDAIKPVGTFKRILCPPIFGPGSLLLGVQQDNHLVVQALSV